jgi:hypothetical protein
MTRFFLRRYRSHQHWLTVAPAGRASRRTGLRPQQHLSRPSATADRGLRPRREASRPAGVDQQLLGQVRGDALPHAAGDALRQTAAADM